MFSHQPKSDTSPTLKDCIIKVIDHYLRDINPPISVSFQKLGEWRLHYTKGPAGIARAKHYKNKILYNESSEAALLGVLLTDLKNAHKKRQSDDVFTRAVTQLNSLFVSTDTPQTCDLGNSETLASAISTAICMHYQLTVYDNDTYLSMLTVNGALGEKYMIEHLGREILAIEKHLKSLSDIQSLESNGWPRFDSN